MRRSWRFRLVALIFGLWFASVAADAPGTHACPVHGPHVAQMSEMAHSTGASTAHQGSSPSQHNHQHSGCTCLGCCCASARAVLPPVGYDLVAATRIYHEAPAPTLTSVVPSPAEHRHPFATAPPRLAV
jgi:hypothetical protein